MIIVKGNKSVTRCAGALIFGDALEREKVNKKSEEMELPEIGRCKVSDR